jgi:hypothetical protein
MLNSTTKLRVLGDAFTLISKIWPGEGKYNATVP